MATVDDRAAASIPGPESVTDRTLPNGIRALVRENHSSPAVVVDGVLFCGALLEPQDQPGLASLTARMLERGTMHRSFSQISDALEAVGAELGFGSGHHSSSFDAKCLAEDLPGVLDLLAETLAEPAFAADQLDKVRGQLLTALQQRMADTRYRAAVAFRELAYGKAHAYSRDVQGTPESIVAMHRDDLASFYQSAYHPHGGIVVVVGAVDADATVDLLTRTLGTWSPGHEPRRRVTVEAPVLATERREARVSLPGKVQSDIVLGNPAMPRAHPDWLAAAVANTVLGVFGLMGRLGRSVRDKQGLAYYAMSNLAAGLGPGPWLASAGVNPANVDGAIDAILVEMNRMRDDLVPDDELADVKSYVSGSMPLRLETNEGVAGALLDIALYNLDLDHLQTFASRVEAVQPDDIREAARAHLHPGSAAIAVAGPAAD